MSNSLARTVAMAAVVCGLIAIIAIRLVFSNDDALGHTDSDRLKPPDAPAKAAQEPNDDANQESTDTTVAREPSIDEQAAAIEKISPLSHDQISTSSGTYLELIGGKIGRVNPNEVREGNTGSIVALLQKHAIVTGAYDGLKVDIVSIRKKGTGNTAIFRQLIDEIPVDLLGKVSYDANGDVSRLNSLIIDPTSVKIEPTILEAEAVVHAKTALANELGQTVSNVRTDPPENIQSEFREPTLYIGLDEQSASPVAYWIVTMLPAGAGHTYIAQVDAVTGDTRVYSNVMRWDTHVCKDVSAAITACNDDPSIDHDIEEIFEEYANGNAKCVGSQSDCNDSANSNPFEVAKNLESMLETHAPNLCCDNVGRGDGEVHILTDEDITAAEDPNPFSNGVPDTPVYDPFFDGISIPDPSTIPGEFKNGMDFGNESEVIAHEVGHAVLCGLNESNICIGGNVNSAAIVEGIADAIASIYSEEFNLPGQDWKAGENIYDDPNNPKIRDLTENQDFGSMSSPSLSPQENGKIFAHVFYKLKSSGVSTGDLIKVILDVSTNISSNSAGSLGVWEVADFIDALEEAGDAVGPAIRQKIDDVVEEMSAPTSSPVPLGQVEWPGCNGSIARYIPTWWLAAGSEPADSFIVKRKVGSSWVSYWNGDESCTLYQTSASLVKFRVKASNAAGSSGWVYFQGSSSCGGGGGGVPN